MLRHLSRPALIATLIALVSFQLEAQSSVGPDRLLNAAREPQNWLTYAGDYFSNRYSALAMITPANVKSLGLFSVRSADGGTVPLDTLISTKSASGP